MTLENNIAGIDKTVSDATPDFSIGETSAVALPVQMETQEPFRASMTSLKKLRSTWDNPIAAYNPEDRAAMAPMFDSMDPKSRDEVLKRNHLIAYYSDMRQKDFDFVEMNLDSIMEHYHGKPMTVESAHAEIGNIFNAKPETYKPEVGGVAKTALITGNPQGLAIAFGDPSVREQAAALTAAGFANLAGLFPEMARIGTKAALNLPVSMMGKDPESEENMSGFKEIGKAFTNVPTSLIKDNKDFLKEMADIYDQNADKDVIDTFKTQGASAAAEKMFKEAFVAAPELGLLIASGPYAIPLIGATSGTRKYNELDMNNPDISENKKEENALATGLVNMVTFKLLTYDKVLGMGIGPKMGAEIKKGLIPALTDFAAKFGIQTSQMDIVAAAEHAINTMTDVENPKGMFETLLNTTVSTAPLNFGFAAVGSKSFANMEAARGKVRNTLEFRVNEILAKGENATDKEILERRKIETMLESRDMDKIIQMANFENMRNTYEQHVRGKSYPESEELDTANRSHLDDEDAMTGEDIEAAAVRENRTLKQFDHHPADTVQAVEDLQHDFPNVKQAAFTDVSQLPEAVRKQAEADGHDLNRIQAFPYGDTIYVNANTVKPHEVPKLFLGEVMHVGLEKAFGGKLEPLLDQIAKTPEYQPEIKVFAEKYKSDNPDVENKFDIETVEGQRKAVGEFLAHTSRVDAKPAFWKEILFTLKQWLRKIPGLHNMRLTDRELEGILSKGYRKMENQKSLTDSAMVDKSVKTGDVKPIVLKDSGRYSSFLDKRFADNKLGLEKNQRTKLEQAYKDFPIGESFTNKWGEQIHFSPKPGGDVDEYIHHFLIKRGQGGTEAYSDSHLELFKQFISNAKNPDNRILGISKNKETGIETPSVYYVKQIHDPKGYHTIIALVEEPSSRILSWTHFDTKESYVQNKLIKPEKELIEKYGLVDKNGNNVDITYDEYLKRKESDIPLYLATDGGLPASQPQAAPPAPDSIISQSLKKSSLKTDFSLAPRYSDRQMELMAKALWTTVDKMKGDLPADSVSFKILKEKGFNVYDENDAHTAAVTAKRLILDRNNRTMKAAKDKWRSNEYPILSDLRKAYGENVKIKPSSAFKGEYESDFINTKKGKNTVLSDEATKKLGITEEELFKEIGKLKNVDMEKGYQDYRQNKTGRKGKIQRELQEQGNFFGAYEIIHGDQPLNDWIIKNQSKVAEEVYQQLMGEPLPEGKAPDWDAVRAKLAEEKAQRPQPSSESSTSSASSEKLGEGITYEKFKRMQIALERAMDEKVSLQEAQKAATDAAMDIPVEQRGGFLHKVANLSKFTDTPTPAYPEGRRSVELERLLEDMSGFAHEVAKSAMLEKIDARLDQTNLRRVGKGRVASLYGDAQKDLDEIRDIRQLSSDSVIDKIEYYQQVIDQKQNDGNDASFEQNRAAMLEGFGMLDGKNPEELRKVYKQIDQLARFGRNQLKQFIEERRADLEMQRDEVVRIVTGGKGLIKPQTEDIQAQKFKSRKEDDGMKIWNDAQNLQDMLHWISAGVPENFKNTALFKFIEKAHISETKSVAGRNKRVAAALSAFDETFGTKTPYQRAKKCQELKTKVDNSGVFRNQRDPNNQLHGIEFDEVSADDARKMLADHDSGKGTMTDYQAEAVRMKLSDMDQRLKNEFPMNRIDDGISDDVLKVLQDENKKDVVLIPKIKDPGEPIEQPLTQMEALYMKLCWDQPTVRYKMAFNGWTEESIQQLDKFIRPEVAKFGKWMVADLANDLPNLSEVYENMYMTAIKGLPDYFPTDYKGTTSKDIGNIYSGEMTVTPGMLTARKSHYVEPQKSDALDIYLQHVIRAEHFKSHAETGRDMIAVFKNRKVRTAIEQYYGKTMYDGITERIGYFVNAGNKNAQIVPFFSKMQSSWAFMKLAVNTVSGIKQMVGGVSYINEIPVKAYLNGKLEFWKHPLDNAAFLMDTEYFRNRFGGSMDRDVSQMFSRGKFSISKMEALFKGANEKAMLPIRLGDAAATIIDGFSVYKYHYDNLLKEGMSEALAKKQALLRWEMATETTQQSGQTHMMNAWQMGNSLTRLLTTFRSNPILQGNAFMNAAHDAYKGKPGAWSQVAKTHFVAFAVGGLAMELIAQAWQHGVNWDEYELGRMAYSLTGPFGSMTALDVLGDSLVKVIAGLNNYGTTSNIPFIDDLTRSLHSGMKLASGDYEEDEVYRIIERVIGGMGYMPLVGPPAKQTTSIMRELRRYYNLMFSGEK